MGKLCAELLSLIIVVTYKLLLLITKCLQLNNDIVYHTIKMFSFFVFDFKILIKGSYKIEMLNTGVETIKMFYDNRVNVFMSFPMLSCSLLCYDVCNNMSSCKRENLTLIQIRFNYIQHA